VPSPITQNIARNILKNIEYFFKNFSGGALDGKIGPAWCQAALRAVAPHFVFCHI
jgi:hypothetical protein